MRRRTTASALFALVLCTGLAPGQPPPVKAPADPTDALIQKALANDPDVQVARAKLTLADAELAKARQTAVGKVLSLRDAIEEHRATVDRLTDMLELKERAVKSGAGSRDDLFPLLERVAVAKAALARAETELRLLTGDGPKVAASEFRVNAGHGLMVKIPPLGPRPQLPPDQDPEVVKMFLEMLGQGLAQKSSAGPIPDRIRAALDKKVRLGNKGDGIALDAAMAVFKKDAGLDVPIRGMPSPIPRVTLEGEELPVGAWFQLFQDHGQNKEGLGFAFYVREYGLLVATSQTAPPDAVTLTEFWRSRPAAVQPAPKEPAGERVEVPHDNVQGGIKAKLGVVVVVTFPVKADEVDDAKIGADGVASARMGSAGGGRAAVLVWGNRAGRATVTWDITTADGRRFTNRGTAVEFE